MGALGSRAAYSRLCISLTPSLSNSIPTNPRYLMVIFNWAISMVLEESSWFILNADPGSTHGKFSNSIMGGHVLEGGGCLHFNKEASWFQQTRSLLHYVKRCSLQFLHQAPLQPRKSASLPLLPFSNITIVQATALPHYTTVNIPRSCFGL